MASKLYMVVERFKNGDAVSVYRRFRDHGRMAPQGLAYVSSWVDEKLGRCYQLMETDDRRLLDEWMARWSDLVEFEVHEVLTSQTAFERIAPRLYCPGRRRSAVRAPGVRPLSGALDREEMSGRTLSCSSCRSPSRDSFLGIPCRPSAGPALE